MDSPSRNTSRSNPMLRVDRAYTTVPSMEVPSGLFRNIDLDESNWYAWKRKTMAILRDRGLLPYVMGDRRHRPRDESDAVVWERYNKKAKLYWI